MPDQTPAPLTDEQLQDKPGHAIHPNAWLADLTAEHLAVFRSDPHAAAEFEVSAMAAELLAARTHLGELEAAAPKITAETSDGHHTFAELYHYRMLYNAALFNEWAAQGRYDVHKSIRHADGELCFDGDWFVVYAQLPTGQISNHYEMTDWDRFRVPERDRAAEWDGHTPQQVAERLAAFLKLGPPGGPRFSQRHLEQVTRERDAARERITELEAERDETRRPFSQRQCVQAMRDRDEAQARAAWPSDRDLITEGREKLNALAESPSTDRAFDLALWAGLNLAVLLDAVEASQRPPAGYVVGWDEGDGVRLVANEDDDQLCAESGDAIAHATLGDARMYAAECTNEDPSTVFRVYELREVGGRG